MIRWMWLIVFTVLMAPAFAAVEIIDLPDELDARYDVTWTVTATGAMPSPLLLEVERSNAGKGYLLRLDNAQASWEQSGVKSPQPVMKAAMKLETGKPYLFTLKRRPDTVALLLNHRLILCAPAPSLGGSSIRFAQVPGTLTIDKARYRNVDTLRFGDDFMRPESQKRLLSNPTSWVEDDTWKVAFFKKDNPGTDPRDPKTNAAMVTPWQLSIFGFATDTISNGFWFLYRGTGPSWVVANPKMVYPTWDQYYVQAAVKTEYNGEVGIIAGYQDNKNYLLFRWKQREYIRTGAVRAELVQVVDGNAKVIATSQRGFDPEQWYTLRVNLGWKHVQALVDDTVLMQARYYGPVEGRIGLYANGSDSPNRPKVDEITASMYVSTDEGTGKTVNEAAGAQRTTSLIYFDDVRVGDWVQVGDALNDTRYPISRNGKWVTKDDLTTAGTAGRVMIGSYAWGRYGLSTRVMASSKGAAGIFLQMDPKDNGYLWTLSPGGQKLQQVVEGDPKSVLDTSKSGIQAGDWATLRAEADGPYIALYLNNRRVMEHYDPGHAAGRCGVLATGGGVKFAPVAIELDTSTKTKLALHKSFTVDRWLVTWSSPESDWYPGFTWTYPYITPPPSNMPHQTAGAAAPLPTDKPGIYWNKGGYYGDLRITIPVSPKTMDGQVLHLTSNYDAANGYRFELKKNGQNGAVRLMRNGMEINTYNFTLTDNSRLVLERRGSYLLLTAQQLDPEETAGEPEILKEELIFAYRDGEQLKANMVGFTVKSPQLPAAVVEVVSDRIEEVFEQSPTRWLCQSGVWAIMARYSCQPQWNWFGGFGAGTPTVWSKYRLDGDQTVEAYMGVKMQYDNQPEEYARRYRDLCVTICSDGEHLNSGYSLIRAGRIGTQPITMLLRKGAVVQMTDKQDYLLPQQNQGHRQWFATRLEKRGSEIKVFLDNRLAMTYKDPDPLPGGYAGIWTLNNGLMLGRANLSAEKMTLGAPRAAAPLAVQEDLPPLPSPQVAVNGTPVTVCTFENGLDGWSERKGITGRLLRERKTFANGVANTYLKVVNTFPAGDLSVNAVSKLMDLDATPTMNFDYCFDPGANINLYVKSGQTYYEILLTGKEASEANVYTAGKLPAVADGSWHHLEANLAKLVRDAIMKQSGAKPDHMMINEIVFADWSASSEMRAYGFGVNVGGLAICFDNFALQPAMKGTATISWQSPDGKLSAWKTGVDNTPFGAPATEISAGKQTVNIDGKLRFFHLLGKTADGKPGGMLHLALADGE